MPVPHSTMAISCIVHAQSQWICKAVLHPAKIPLEIYTHLNYAFASIDPDTFEVIPPNPSEAKLMTRLTDLKQRDPSLRVVIAIRGWSFNDFGPTATTFSDLAASEANQRKFFKSLISFMATYGFDGVDIDWEYPAADDRNGRVEDFANFPNHTNLTEVRDVMDLLWRYNISPDQVVLGMVFYGRTFALADTSCSQPGCLFTSGGQKGDCSLETSSLMNSELDEIRVERGISPKLDKESAAQILVWDDQWVIYDDEKTFRLKMDFAKDFCLGGVMVWAVNEPGFLIPAKDIAL
ncbi:glycoside hydrolase superfamily [Aspergillus multicolor]|uniref:glycoside hydrolase superfamily n=1 Tax=Aspergillus multicolor TaxID=41759 RepID=UPI003CCE2A76